MICPVFRDHGVRPCEIVTNGYPGRKTWKQCLTCGQVEMTRTIKSSPAGVASEALSANSRTEVSDGV